MLTLRAHDDGQNAVLDDPPPACLEANAPVEVLIPDQRNRALAEWRHQVHRMLPVMHDHQPYDQGRLAFGRRFAGPRPSLKKVAGFSGRQRLVPDHPLK